MSISDPYANIDKDVDMLDLKMLGFELAVNVIRHEYRRAIEKFPKFNSPHEGYAVVLEEVDELWDEVKDIQSGTIPAEHTLLMQKEAIQVAAVAIRFLTDCC